MNEESASQRDCDLLIFRLARNAIVCSFSRHVMSVSVLSADVLLKDINVIYIVNTEARSLFPSLRFTQFSRSQDDTVEITDETKKYVFSTCHVVPG